MTAMPPSLVSDSPGRRRLLHLASFVLGATFTTACAVAVNHVGTGADRDKTPAATWIALRDAEPMDQLIDKLADHRVVLVGESHTRFDHHLQQLAILRGLHARHPDIALGVEWFQRPAQPHLDDFVAGRITEAEMLDRTGYFDRWRFDYRLYRPVIRYAKEHGIPIVALNAEAELTDRISEVGIDGLAADEKTRLPDIDRSDAAYAEYLRQFFAQHPGGPKRSFDRFLDVQLTWDETMADTAARYLQAHPGRRMVLMAGSGHIAYGWGIPKRLQRRLPEVATATVVFDDGKQVSGDLADYLVFSPESELPKAGLLGLFLDTGADGVKVRSVADDSAAGAAGIEGGDLLVAIDDRPIASYGALRLAMLDMQPNDKVRLTYRRESLFGGPSEKTVEVVLR
jgi:uncharacterized iron-regulated protein